VPRLDLTEQQLEGLVRWCRALPDREKADQVLAVVAELRTLRERESNTRMLMEIEGEV
jgi:hypothetical protein